MSYTPGPFDSEHIYVQWGGKLPGPDTWNCGLRMRKKSAGAVDDGTSLLVGVSAAIAAYHTDLSTGIGAPAKLSYVKVNAINTAGQYRDNGNTVQAVYADLAGGGVGVRYPNQIALCVSLTTGFSRGSAHKGRFYLPLPVWAVGADGRIAASDAQNTSITTDTLMAALNSVNADYEVAVFSRKAGAPGHRRVTGNLVGRTLDTQRRRRRSVPEDYQ